MTDPKPPAVRLLFDVGHLLVDDRLLGQAIDIQRNARTFTFRIPATDDGFDFGQKNETWELHAFGSGGGGVGHGDSPLYRQLLRFGPMSRGGARTIAVIAVDIAMAEAEPFAGLDRDEAEKSSNRSSLLMAVRELAPEVSRLMEAVLAQIRIATGQYWLPASDATVKLLTPILLVSPNRTPVWFDQFGGSLIIIGEYPALTPELFGDVARLLAVATPGVSSEQLVQDAHFYSQFGSDLDRAKATLFSALACETKIRAVLLAHATKDNRDLLNTVLGHQSKDTPTAAVELFNRPARSVLGVSLRDSNKELWKRLAILFEARNKFAHALVLPALAEATAHAATAAETLQWITHAELMPRPA